MISSVDLERLDKLLSLAIEAVKKNEALPIGFFLAREETRKRLGLKDAAQHRSERVIGTTSLLLECIEPGTRVRADGDVIYVTEDLEVASGTEGSVEQSRAGLSHVRWDTLNRVVPTSNDCIQKVPL